MAALLLVVNAGTRDTPQLDPVVRPAHVYRTVVAQGLPCLFSVAVYDSKHDVFVSASIADRKLWDAGVVRVLLAALEQCSGGAFVDVGANIGYFSLLAARLGHRVVAFEPAAASADRLAFGVAENELQHLVTVFRNGASDSTAVAFLAPAADNQGGRSMLVGDTLNQQGERVQLVRLDDVPAVMQLPRVAAVKLDVEVIAVTFPHSGHVGTVTVLRTCWGFFMAGHGGARTTGHAGLFAAQSGAFRARGSQRGDGAEQVGASPTDDAGTGIRALQRRCIPTRDTQAGRGRHQGPAQRVLLAAHGPSHNCRDCRSIVENLGTSPRAHMNEGKSCHIVAAHLSSVHYLKCTTAPFVTLLAYA